MFFLLGIHPSLKAAPDVIIPAIFSSGMVLHQNAEVKIWGRGNEGLTIIVDPDWGEAVSVLVSDGKWELSLKTPVASYQARQLVISKQEGSKAAVPVKTLDRVLIGEVWLAAGQSNMKMTLSDADYNELIASAEDEALRMYRVEESLADSPQELGSGQWLSTASVNNGSMAAVSWFFARKLKQDLDVPVAVINASYGDSNIEAWSAASVFAENEELRKYYLEEKENLLPHRRPSALFNDFFNDDSLIT